MTLSFINSVTNVQSTTITLMSGISAGDILVLFDSGVLSSLATPSGWTTIIASVKADTGYGGTANTRISYKIATGSESSTTITGSVGTSNEVTKAVLQFRNSTAPTKITIGSIVEALTDGDPAAQTTLASGGTAPLIGLRLVGSQATISGDTYSPAVGGSVSSGSAFSVDRQKINYNLYTSSPADLQADIGDLGTGNKIVCFYMQLGFGIAYTLTLDTAAFTLAAQALTLKRGVSFALGTGAFTVSAKALTLSVGHQPFHLDTAGFTVNIGAGNVGKVLFLVRKNYPHPVPPITGEPQRLEQVRVTDPTLYVKNQDR